MSEGCTHNSLGSGNRAREDTMNEVEREFLLETHENLSQIDLDLVALEKEPGELKTLARVSRLLRNKAFREQLIHAPSAQAAYDLIATEEGDRP